MRNLESIAFSRDARRLIIRAQQELRVVGLGEPPSSISLPIQGLRDFGVVDDEVWVVAGAAPELRRFDMTGAEVGSAHALNGEGRLRTAPFGAAAVWTSSPMVMLALTDDDLETIEIPGQPDAVVPISSRRWLLQERDRVTLGEPSVTRWTGSPLPRGARVVGGAAIFDGHSIALDVVTPGATADEPEARQLVVLAMRDGRVQNLMTLVGAGAVRFARRRGLALVRTGPRSLVLVDLRFGRVVKHHEESRDIEDLAIDDAGQEIALRLIDTEEMLLLPVRALAPGSGHPAEPETADTVQMPVRGPAAPEARPRSAPEPGLFHAGGLALGGVELLSPRPDMAMISRRECRALLERYRVLVAALLARAIASAWDEGRIAFEGPAGLPFRAEVQGLLGRVGGRAPDDVATAEQEATVALGEVRAAEAGFRARLSPMAALAREFGLSGLAQQILLVVAGPALWGELARLYGILANDEGRPLCDELLLYRILGPKVSRHDIARELDRDRPLVESGMIRVGEGRMRPFLALTVDPLVVTLLRATLAEGTTDDDIRVVDATRTLDELLIPAALKDRVVADVAKQPPNGRARLVVRGREGSGRHTLLATLADAAGRRLGAIDATPILRDLRHRLDDLRTLLQRALLQGLLPCLDGLENLPSDDRVARDQIREVLQRHPGPLAIRLPWDGEVPLSPGYLQIDIPSLSIAERIVSWQLVLRAHGLYVREPGELATRFSVGPGVITSVVERVAAEQGTAAAPPVDVVGDLDRAVRQHLESRLGATATRVTRLATWSQVVLPPDIQDSLLELIARIRHRWVVYEQWGFSRVMTSSRGVTALFQGGPGTGKTLVASAIASELGLDLYRVDLSRVMSKWIGETEQNLARLFDAAEDGHAIILFDEADSLFAKRTEVRTSVDRYANLEVNYLLQRLDSFEGIAILTTNFGTAIDSAFKRRLSLRLTFPFPDDEMREQLWRSHLPAEVPRAGEFDLGDLARRYRLSGGYIRNAVVRAAFLAAEEQSPLTQEHLERAIRAEFREIGKLADTGILE